MANLLDAYGRPIHRHVFQSVEWLAAEWRKVLDDEEAEDRVRRLARGDATTDAAIVGETVVIRLPPKYTTRGA